MGPKDLCRPTGGKGLIELVDWTHSWFSHCDAEGRHKHRLVGDKLRAIIGV